MYDFAALQQRLLNGHELTEEEAYRLAELDDSQLEGLTGVARALTEHYFHNRVSLCAIWPAKTGYCSGDCAFCAQSAHHQCEIEINRIEDIDVARVIEHIKKMRAYGVSRFAFVTSGEALTEAEFEQILVLYRQIQASADTGLCASLGTLTPERARRLVEAGVSRYHHNLETAASFFPRVCTTHSYESKLQTIRLAQEAGMQVCSGGIISLGESLDQRLEMAFELKRLDVDCVPVNILNPIPGTRLEHQPLLSVNEILRTIAMFRLILPQKTIRYAGGRENALGEAEYRGYLSGVNAAIFGHYLTTRGRGYQEGLQQLQELGLTVI